MDREIGEISSEQIDNQIANYERLMKTHLTTYGDLARASGMQFEGSLRDKPPTFGTW